MKNKTFHSGGIPCIYLTGKFANCTPEILKVYYKICREHQNCATEISVAQYKLSRLVHLYVYFPLV